MHAESEYIREAIRREEYPKALAQWNSYACRLRAALEAGTLGPGQMEGARALFEWSRTVLIGARAQLQARIRELEVASTYARPSAPPASRIEARF